MNFFLINIVFLTSIFLHYDCFGFRATVTKVVDGDSIVITSDHSSLIKVRLAGIDTPELQQEFGPESKQVLEEKVLNKTVSIVGDKKDRYGRLIAYLEIGSRWINKELVEEGYAWHYKAYSDDKRLAAGEVSARNAGRGLWGDSNPIPPWEFRSRGESRKDEARQSKTPVTGFWLNTSSGTRHNSNCRHYRKTKIGRPCEKSEGKPCKTCGG